METNAAEVGARVPSGAKDTVDSTAGQVFSEVCAGGTLKAGEAIPLPPPSSAASSSVADPPPTSPLPAEKSKRDIYCISFNNLSGYRIGLHKTWSFLCTEERRN